MNWFDANYTPWLIPIPPFLGFLLIILAAGRSKLLSNTIAIIGVAISFVLGWAVVLNAIQFKTLGIDPAQGGVDVFAKGTAWLANGTGGTASGALNMGTMVDPLTTIMLFMVPLACLLIFIYSLGYMAHDP